MVDTDTIISGSSAKKIESSGTGGSGKWDVMYLLGAFEFGDQNQKYKFNNMNEALRVMGDDPKFSGTKAIRAAFKARDIVNGNTGISSLVCIPTRKGNAASVTLKGTITSTDETPSTEPSVPPEEPTEPTEPEVKDIITIKALEGSKGNTFTATRIKGSFRDNKFIIQSNGKNIIKKDNISIANFIKIAEKSKLLHVELADGIKKEDLINVELADIVNEPFTGGSEEETTAEGFLEAMENVKDETFARLCFTDMLDESFFDIAMDYGVMKFELNKGSSIYFSVDPELTLDEKVDIFLSTPDNSITYVHQTINDYDVVESCITHAALCSGVKVGDSIAHGEISWINRVYPEYSREELTTLANAGGTSYRIKNRQTNGYGVARAMTASQAVDEKGNKAAESYQHITDTLFYLQDVLNVDNFLNKTGISRTLPAIDGYLTDQIKKEIANGTAADITAEITVDKEKNSILHVKINIKGNPEIEWIEYEYTVDFEDYE